MSAKKFITLLLLLSVLILLGGCGSRGNGDSPVILREETVARGNLQEIINLTGTLEARRRADLPFLQGGTLLEVLVEEGQSVRENDLLLRLDTSQMELDLRDAQLTVQLQQIALEQLRAGPSEYDIAAATASVARAQSQLNQIASPPSEEAVRIAQANLDIARSNYWVALTDRDAIERVPSGGQDRQNAELDISANELAMSIAQQDLINVQQGASSGEIGVARASVYQAQATLQQLLGGVSDFDLRTADLQIQLAQLALSRAESAMADAEIRAPFAGIVTQISVNVGEQITPGLPIVTLIDDEDFVIDVYIDELDVPRLKPGLLSFITLDAFSGARFSAHLDRISPDATVIQGIASYEVRLIVDPVDLPIRDGMTATIEIVVSELTDIIMVPNWAIRFDRESGQAYVAVLADDGLISEVPISVGTRGEEYSEVLDGLSPGATVILVQEESFSVLGIE